MKTADQINSPQTGRIEIVPPLPGYKAHMDPEAFPLYQLALDERAKIAQRCASLEDVLDRIGRQCSDQWAARLARETLRKKSTP